ncbi:MAG: hypothetical protein EPO12_15770 [Aquabacterium sp.]|jgi:MSHA biogenesis protein MshI|nr:MAG: hypothetical protein EPO12_15770 [Aquabacterium sp.]
MDLSTLLARLKPRAAAKATEHLGITCSPSRLSAAVVRADGDGRAHLLGQVGFEGDLDMAQISRWLRKNKLKPDSATLMLPGDEYQILPFDAPSVPAVERAEATRWRIKDMIDFPVEDACVDCLMLPAPDGQGQSSHALAIVSRRQQVREWMQRVRKAGIELSAVDIPELALRNLLALQPTPNACALLRIGATRASLIVVWKGELCTFRRFEISAPQFAAADLHSRQAQFERLGLEVQRTADAFERQFYGTAIERVWVEQSVPEVDLVQQLAPQVTLRVQPFALGDWMNLERLPVPPADTPTPPPNLIAVGAAVRATLVARDEVAA